MSKADKTKEETIDEKKPVEEAKADKPPTVAAPDAPKPDDSPKLDELPILGGTLMTSGFIAQDSPISEGFKRFPMPYLMYDQKYAAPHGALRGTVRRIESYVVGGDTRFFLIVKPTMPCAAITVVNGVAMITRATSDSFVALVLHEPPQNLLALLTPTHWIEIEVRASEHGWVIFFNPDKIGKGA